MTPTDTDRGRAREIYYSAIESHARSAGKVPFPPSWVSDDRTRVSSPSEYIISAFAAALAEARRGTIEECERIAFSYGGNENSASRRIAERIHALAAPDQGKPPKEYFDVQPPGNDPQKIG